MRASFRTLVFSAIAAVTLVAAPLQAVAKSDKKTADTMVTVYVSAHGGSSMAGEVNESHVKMEAQGWRFVDLEIHTENGDTEGAWITYVK